MRIFLCLVVACGAAGFSPPASASGAPQDVVREFYAARADGDVPRVLALLATTMEPLTRGEIKNDIESRCLELRSLHVQPVGELEVDAIAYLVRPPRRTGPVLEELEHRTFRFVRENGALRIEAYPIVEEKLIDAIEAAQTPEDVATILAANEKALTPLFVRRLVTRAIKVGRAKVGRPDRRLADISYHVAATIGDPASLIFALGAQSNSMRFPGAPIEPMLALMERALQLARELGDPQVLSFAANNYAVAHMNTDQSSREAEAALREGLARRDELAPYYLTSMLGNLGLLQMKRGDYAAAYRSYIGAHELEFERGDEYGMGFNEVQLGTLMAAQHDYELAMEFFRRATRRKTIKVWVVRGHLGLAEANRVLGRYDEAREAANQALEFATGTPFTGAVARAHVILAEIQIAQGEMQGAEERLQKAVEIARKAPNDENGLVVSLLTLGKLQLRMGRFAEARAVADEIVSLSTRYDFPFPERYDALVLAARAERGLGDREKAIAAYQIAIDAIEAARHVVAGSERQQRLFFEPFHSAYTEVADLLLEKGAVAEALTFAERAKARVLLDAIGRERKSVEETLSQSDRERLAKLVRSLGEANKRALALQTAKDAPPAEMNDAVAQQRLAQHDLARFDADVAGRDPRLRSVRASSTIIDAAGLASLVERPDLAILEFIVQERVTHLLIVDRRGITHRRIEVTSADLDKRIEAFRGELTSRNLRYRVSARALYDLLLAPAAAQLKGKRVLAIVPDNVLWRLPFEALLAPDRKFVIERAACFYIPSITIYRDMLARQEQAAGTDLVAAFGNPSLEGTREEVGAIYRSVDLGPLPDAEDEVRAIAKTWGPSTFVYTREDAREDAARIEMQRARVVHFAAHGIFDDVNPMFSQIVLARGPQSQDDGVLQAWELMRLDLAADLVVLAACDTARGKYGAGEGLIGMSWALFAGGCPSTVVAQWKVSSQSSARLMVEFHRMLAKNASSPFAKAEALRSAQLTLLRDARTAHPFYWSAFVLVGSPAF